mmetsp:Transcript_10323/g.19535  ORF Transcript_10323/g.19535 Transcript_10323/m.19535 type:complete len:120 (+) Transcript_10323:674-1033(+)
MQHLLDTLMALQDHLGHRSLAMLWLQLRSNSKLRLLLFSRRWLHITLQQPNTKRMLLPKVGPQRASVCVRQGGPSLRGVALDKLLYHLLRFLASTGALRPRQQLKLHRRVRMHSKFKRS